MSVNGGPHLSSKPEQRLEGCKYQKLRFSQLRFRKPDILFAIALSLCKHLLICSYMNLFNRSSLSICFVPGTVPGTGEPSRIQDRVLPSPCLESSYYKRRRQSVSQGALSTEKQ